jgi:Lrp/AsnC family leucine-responsive transcriptional regulator
MPYRETLDEIDVDILRCMQTDGRITNAELARRVGLSAPSVLQRVRKLEELGLIQGFYAHLDREKLGYGILVLVQIGLSLHHEKAIEQFRRAVKAMPEVLECLHTSGDFDFQLKVVATDMREYETIVTQRISQIRGIGKIHSCFVLGMTKYTTELPI